MSRTVSEVIRERIKFDFTVGLLSWKSANSSSNIKIQLNFLYNPQ